MEQSGEKWADEELRLNPRRSGDSQRWGCPRPEQVVLTQQGLWVVAGVTVFSQVTHGS